MARLRKGWLMLANWNWTFSAGLALGVAAGALFSLTLGPAIPAHVVVFLIISAGCMAMESRYSRRHADVD